MTKLNTKSNTGKAGLIYFSAFALPVVMYMLLCALNHKLPFGDDTYLGLDMVNQYIKYFSYLQSIAAGENDAFYTYTKALGGDMTGIWTYYLLSPLNIVFLFVPKATFPAAITFVTAVKLGLCGLGMAVLLTKLYKPCAAVLAFSSAYAFMSYNLLYFNNIMWLDGVYMLPLIILGLERIVEGKSARLYTICLSLALIFNYYIGYMICIFIVLFFAYRMLAHKLEDNAAIGAAVLRFTASSLVSGALAAFVLLPTALSLAGTKASFDTAKLGMYQLYTLGQHLSKLICGAVPTGLVEGDVLMSELPAVYCGALVSILALMFFFNGKIKLPGRLVAAAFAVMLFLSFNYNGTYVIWHAFNYPALFPYRNAFLASFLMIWLAWQCYVHKNGIKIRTVILALALVALAVLIIDPLHNHMVSKKMLLLDIGAIAVFASLLLCWGKRFSERFLAAALTVVQCFLLLVNANFYASGSLNSKTYAASYASTQEKVDRVKSYDDGFYRMNAESSVGSNAAMLFLYNGLDHFSSAEKTSTKEFVINFGFRHFLDVWVHYGKGGTSSGDAFLGFKYLMGSLPEYKNYETVDGEAFYYNPNALDIAFPSNKQVLAAELDTDNIFHWQERVFSSALGHSANIFLPQQDVKLELRNMSEKAFGDSAIEYHRIKPDEDHALIYRFTATENAPLYMYTSMPYVEGEVSAKLSVNGKDLGQYLGSYYWRAVCLGTFEVGEQVEVAITPNSSFFLQNASYFAYEDQEALARACAEINSRSDKAVFEKVKNSYLCWQGTVSEDSKVLLFTIPNDKGWRAEVDGKPAQVLTALDTLIAIELSPGEHSVELRFTPPGMYAGIGISLAALVIFLILSKKRIL